MKLRPHHLLSIFALAGLPLQAALAADYDPPIYVDEVPEYVPVEIGSGWYLRGDVGYAVSSSIGQVGYRTFDPVTATYGSAQFDTQNIDNDFTWAVGFGYRFNDFFRSDLTVEGFRTDFDGTTSSGSPCIDPAIDPAYAGTGCRSEDGSSVSSIGVMLNGYVDLGTFVGLTPYVGGGVGYTRVSWANLDSTAYCVDDIAACPAPGGAAGSASHSGEADWRFTYALMAGVAYDITNNLKLDVGYKYRHTDGGDMFAWDAGSAAAGASGVQGTDDGFSMHEVRLGLRYELW